MNNPVTISTGGVVVITDQNVIISGIAPVSVSLSTNFTQYYIYNSTSSVIPFISGFSYTDLNGVLQNYIPANYHLQLVQYTDGVWLQFAADASFPFPGRPYVLPVANASILGGVKGGGSNIVISNDGTINAINGLQVQSDWDETNSTQPDFIKNKPTFLQEQSDWDESDNTQPDFIKNKPSIPPSYTLPAASSSVRGGIRVGSGLVITGDLLSAPGSGSGITQLTGDVLAGPGAGSQPSVLATIGSSGTVGDTTHVAQVTIDAKGRVTGLVPIAITGVSPTCMPKASEVGILANGTDQTANLISALSNANYSGIIFDYSAPAAVTINGSVNAGGKVLKFIQGNTITGTYTIINFILDTGLRQKCFDIGTSGVPVGIINPIGTTLSVISPWVFGMKDDGSDVSRAWQATIDCCIRNGSKVSKITIPTGTYTCNNPVIEYNWNGSFYAPHQVLIEGETNFSEASGFGTVINFTRHDCFGFGTQASKGGSLKNIKLNGPYAAPTFASQYAFYTANISAFTDGVTRDTRYSPNTSAAIDPFGPSVPVDGGYPGNDAYGNPLSGYYRGSTNGTTGFELDNVFRAGWVVCLITSPNGQTVNAELIRDTNFQYSNYKWCVSGCQAQEKGNLVAFGQAWGSGYGLVCSNQYGAGSIGQWTFTDWDIAGLNQQLGTHDDSGYFPWSFFRMYAESIGSLGSMKSNQGALMVDCKWNFAAYVEAGAYKSGQVHTPGYTHIGGQIRNYGTFKPVTIDNTTGPIYFENVAFEVVPFFTTGYARGNSSFKNCTVGDTGILMNPDDLQVMASNSWSDSVAYGNSKINSGGRIYSSQSSYPAMPLPLNRVSANYVVTISLVSGFYQATISVPADEANRVFTGDLIVASTTLGGVQQVLGIVQSVSGGNMVVKYINNSAFISGNSYYLYVWLPLYNVSFTGDISSASNQIINVSVKYGSPASVINNFGLIYTLAIPTTDSFNSHLVRMISYNSGTGIITIDKNASANATKLLIANTDAKPDPGTPSIVSGAAAGSSPTLSITKGNDKSMQVSFTQGTSPITGVLATVSFSLPFPGGYIPSVKFSPANGNAAALNGATQVWMDAANTNSFTINTGSSALSAGVVYVWGIEAN